MTAYQHTLRRTVASQQRAAGGSLRDLVGTRSLELSARADVSAGGDQDRREAGASMPTSCASLRPA